MQLPQPKRREMGENMIPLINVVFLLLIFFMLTGMLAAPEPFQVQPPNSRSDAETTEREGTLLLAADGRLALDGEELAREALPATLHQRLAAQPDLRLKLKADAEVTAPMLMDLLDELREVGVKRLTLLTRLGEA